MARTRAWVLPDTVIAGRGEDRFDLHAVAQELADVVQSSSASMAIGLLAPYGTGKSSVIRMLGEELAVNRDWAVLRVSAENHSGIARARALLYGLLDAARTNQLLDDDAYEDQRACLEGARQRAVPRPTSNAHVPGKAKISRYPRAVLASAMWVFASVFSVWSVGVAAVLLAHLLGHGSGVNPWSWFAARGATSFTSLLLTAPVVALILGTARDAGAAAAKRPEISITSPRPDTTDELEQAFLRLLHTVRRRIVIAIDDIDRLSAADVLDALTVVRSLVLAAERYEHKPVFVLSCDEDVVREAITGVRPGLAHRGTPEPHDGSPAKNEVTDAKQEATREYLNKLFAARISLPAHQQSDLRDFALLRLTEPTPHPIIDRLGGIGPTQDVLDVLIHRDVRTPRDAVRLLNEFLISYRLASRRENAPLGRAPSITPGGVTGHPLTLARIVVLRADFRVLHDRLVDEHELLALLDEALLGNADVLDDPLLQDFLEPDTHKPDTFGWLGLDFLRATAPRDRRARPLELGALLTFSSMPASRQLGSRTAVEIQRELVGRDVDALLKRFDNVNDTTRLLNAMVRTLESARRGQDLDNAVSTAAAVLGLVSDLPASVLAADDDGRAVLGVSDVVMRRQVDLTVPLVPAELAGLLPVVRESHVPVLVTILSTLPDERPEQQAWAAVMMPLARRHPAREFDAALDEYFVSLCDSGELMDLEFWLDRTGDHELFTPHAFGALLAMAGRSSKAELMAQAARVAVDAVSRHGWHADLVYGLMILPETVELEMNFAILQLLKQVDVPADGWTGVTPARALVTDPSPAARLVKRMTAYLADDDDAVSSGETAELLRSWIPIVGHMASVIDDKSIGDTIAEAIADCAGFCPEVATVAAGLVPELTDAQAAAVVTTVAAELGDHRDESEEVGRILFSVLLEYVRTAPPASDPAAGTSLDALLAAVADDGPAGQFTRMRLPSVLVTQRGHAARARVLAGLVDRLPSLVTGAAPGDGLGGEIITSIHVCLADSATRAANLPQVLARLQSNVAQGHPRAALDFAARYSTEQAIDSTWMAWLAQHWATLSTTAKDCVLAAASRPETLHSGLLPLLTTHLLSTDDDELWEHAAALYAVVDDDRKAQILANARGRCADLAAYATDAPTAVLQAAMVSSEDEVGEVVKLAAGSLALSDAVNDYLMDCIAQTTWYPDRIRAVVAGSTTPSLVWDSCLTEAGHSDTSAERSADIIEALIRFHPAAVPGDLVTRLAPTLCATSEQTVRKLGTAVRALPDTVLRKLDSELKEPGRRVPQQSRRQAFRVGSGYRKPQGASAAP